MDLSNSVILPADDFVELQAAAWEQPPKSVKDKTATTIQTFLICTTLAAAVTGASFGWAKAMKWKADKDLQREVRRAELLKNNLL